MRKMCRSCGENKAYAAFNKRSSSRDGHTPWCKECVAFKRKGRAHGITGGRTEVPDECRREVFLSAILRMKESGIASDVKAQEMAERVGAL